MPVPTLMREPPAPEITPEKTVFRLFVPTVRATPTIGRIGSARALGWIRLKMGGGESSRMIPPPSIEPIVMAGVVKPLKSITAEEFALMSRTVPP